MDIYISCIFLYKYQQRFVHVAKENRFLFNHLQSERTLVGLQYFRNMNFYDFYINSRGLLQKLCFIFMLFLLKKFKFIVDN